MTTRKTPFDRLKQALLEPKTGLVSDDTTTKIEGGPGNRRLVSEPMGADEIPDGRIFQDGSWLIEHILETTGMKGQELLVLAHDRANSECRSHILIGEINNKDSWMIHVHGYEEIDEYENVMGECCICVLESAHEIEEHMEQVQAEFYDNVAEQITDVVTAARVNDPESLRLLKQALSRNEEGRKLLDVFDMIAVHGTLEANTDAAAPGRTPKPNRI